MGKVVQKYIIYSQLVSEKRLKFIEKLQNDY